jgi:uncharacterized protein (TIGR04255 family)
MAQQAHLGNAPITEAVIDINARVPESLELDTLKSLHSLVQDKYPVRKERRQFSGTFQVHEGKPQSTEATSNVDGFLFSTADDKQVFLARRDGFSFNRLRPYESWATVRDEAKRLWGLYKSVSNPFVHRLALRYINKLDIPLPIRDFEDYLTSAPSVPKELPQGVSSFFTRVVIAEPSIPAVAVIIHAFEQIVDPNVLPIYLDIEVFKQVESAIDDETIWNILESLRELKNRVFFSCITERAKELFV